ncbi:membrane protein [Streptomyces pristinaespiralis]|uniref:Membrane protein n=1 Tax=Streptomyces pristinaespiralis TaxID=38300 RepID=A0A0M4DDW9_STRPR|nr:membrane protein [Streptomyces pristinaespiralis]
MFGLGAGTLVLYTALGDVLAGRPGAVVAAPAAVALTLSMGPAEWLLRRFREGTVAALRTSTARGEFRRCTAAVLAECLCGYLAILFALAVAGTVLWPGAPALGGVRSATLLLVGAVLWTGLLLQLSGAASLVAAVCAGAAAVQSVALLTGTGGPALAGLCVAAGSASVLAVLVCVLLGRATAHRL